MTQEGDRRRHGRHAVESPLRLSGPGGEAVGLSANLSEGGVAIREAGVGPVGAKITIAIEGVGVVTGRIVRSGEVTGVAFEVSPEEREMLAAEIMRLLCRGMPV